MAAARKLSTQLDDIAGKAREAIGRATGDKGIENRGKLDQIRARVDRSVRDLKDTLK